MTSSELLQQKLDPLPPKPGCYLFKDGGGKIIYVGKAVSLRSRVRSYFHETVDSPKTRELVKHIADLDFIVVGSELEALILEMNLIKKHRPKYNVRLKDDKRYPYIKVHYADPFPKVTVTRRMDNDGKRVGVMDFDVWVTLVVLEPDVVLGPVLLDQVHLEDERLELRPDDDGVQIGDVLDQLARLGGVHRLVEIRADAVAQVHRLAHVNDLARAVLVKITAGLGWEGVQFL